MSESPKPPPGWYPHPEMADTRRYWDGQAWTDAIAPADQPRASAAPANDESLTGWGFILAFVFPIAGFVIGAVLLPRRAGAGVGIMVLSIVAAVIWYQIYLGLACTDAYC